MESLLEMMRETRAWACYDCGKCTATCPIARVGDEYSPRHHVLQTNLDKIDELIQTGTLKKCLTCSLCDARCPVQVGYTQLIQKLREATRVEGETPECPHGGALQSLMRMMATGTTEQNRLGWLNGDLKTDPEKGEVFYWTGCAMYYDAFFAEYETNVIEGPKAAIRLMNYLGVTPVVSPQERCCGHDLLWNGDRKNFERLARHNVDLVAASGAKILVTSCAECLRTWKIDYAPYYAQHSPRILHITEFLAEHQKELTFGEHGGTKITYQDPCRLGRHLGIYDPPRDMLAAVPGLEFNEMQHSSKRATCCAGGTWSNCDRYAKRIQVDRLKEARGTGAEVLVTACPKCQIHFKCAMKDPNLKEDIEIEMRDIAQVVAEAVIDRKKNEESGKVLETSGRKAK